jgi:hypothetical protein
MAQPQLNLETVTSPMASHRLPTVQSGSGGGGRSRGRATSVNLGGGGSLASILAYIQNSQHIEIEKERFEHEKEVDKRDFAAQEDEQRSLEMHEAIDHDFRIKQITYLSSLASARGEMLKAENGDILALTAAKQLDALDRLPFEVFNALMMQYAKTASSELAGTQAYFAMGKASRKEYEARLSDDARLEYARKVSQGIGLSDSAMDRAANYNMGTYIASKPPEFQVFYRDWLNHVTEGGIIPEKGRQGLGVPAADFTAAAATGKLSDIGLDNTIGTPLLVGAQRYTYRKVQAVKYLEGNGSDLDPDVRKAVEKDLDAQLKSIEEARDVISKRLMEVVKKSKLTGAPAGLDGFQEDGKIIKTWDHPNEHKWRGVDTATKAFENVLAIMDEEDPDRLKRLVDPLDFGGVENRDDFIQLVKLSTLSGRLAISLDTKGEFRGYHAEGKPNWEHLRTLPKALQSLGLNVSDITGGHTSVQGLKPLRDLGPTGSAIRPDLLSWADKALTGDQRMRAASGAELTASANSIPGVTDERASAGLRTFAHANKEQLARMFDGGVDPAVAMNRLLAGQVVIDSAYLMPEGPGRDAHLAKIQSAMPSEWAWRLAKTDPLYSQFGSEMDTVRQIPDPAVRKHAAKEMLEKMALFNFERKGEVGLSPRMTEAMQNMEKGVVGPFQEEALYLEALSFYPSLMTDPEIQTAIADVHDPNSRARRMIADSFERAKADSATARAAHKSITEGLPTPAEIFDTSTLPTEEEYLQGVTDEDEAAKVKLQYRLAYEPYFRGQKMLSKALVGAKTTSPGQAADTFAAFGETPPVAEPQPQGPMIPAIKSIKATADSMMGAIRQDVQPTLPKPQQPASPQTPQGPQTPKAPVQGSPNQGA